MKHSTSVGHRDSDQMHLETTALPEDVRDGSQATDINNLFLARPDIPVNTLKMDTARPLSIKSRLKHWSLFILAQWFVISFGLVILLSYLVPDVARRGGHLASQYTFSFGALALIFFISGLTMDTRALWRNLGSWKMHAITQGMCFILTPIVGLAIVECILASRSDKIPPVVLAGIIIMLSTPTTVASNITFTRQSGGDEEACLIEVTIGNLLGIFITPALVQLYLRPQLGLAQFRPTQPVGIIYKDLIEHFGLALYLPLFLGQCLRNWKEKEVTTIVRHFRLQKWGAVCLLLLLWETFSDCFASGAFKAISTQSILLIVFLNVGLYPLFTLICYLACRPPLPHILQSRGVSSERTYALTKGQTTAVCFCGAPKSITVGLVLINVQYSNFSALDQAVLSIPLALYQGMQVFIAQAFVILFLRWNRASD